MANVLSLVSYKIFPAKLGGQKGIALFNEYFSFHHKLICVTIKDNDPSIAKYEMLNILSNSKLRYINIFYFFKLRKIIRQHHIDHLILEHPYYGWLGLLLKWACGVRLVIHSHNIESLRFKSTGKWWWRILYIYESFIHRRANLTFCITEEDRQFMLTKYGVDPAKATVITYGIEATEPPTHAEKMASRERLCKIHEITANDIIYLFNGTLDYYPNLEALKVIIHKLNPILLREGLQYKILICGKNLPLYMNELAEHEKNNILFAGFVEDISLYFKGADVFINPLTDGGGIKTKLVEALGYDLTCVSTQNGAIGVNEAYCDGKLLISADAKWTNFAERMIKAPAINSTIPKVFYDHFNWEQIALKASTFF